ncbi:hypothetical protein LZ30DRAFT_734607 [Colletotrichum cereale]|nr:hypothetical protein LZ30DRAFT_734607 [Colletotrichum cereale]
MYNNQEKLHSAMRDLPKKSQEVHPAISEWREPRAHTLRPLWDEMFENAVFKSWHQENNKWVLRCVGAPGSGKTTFSALVATKLKNEYAGKRDATASIFLQTDVSSSGAAFVEGILKSVLNQLCVKHNKVATDEAAAYVAKHRQYSESGEHGYHDDFLRDALHSCLSLLDHAFLIIDGVDRCSPAVGLLLENELISLAAKGLKVFLTTRIHCPKTSPVVFCDSGPQEKRKRLGVYWTCDTCKERGFGSKDAPVLCQSCRSKGRTCKNCGDTANLIQPYSHVEMNLGSTSSSFERFIDRNLEMEHGDLGLHSTNEDKPPHSDLGRDLIKARNHDALSILRKRIANQSCGNVSLALLYLSNVHQLQSVESILRPLPDVLPANTVAFFHAGMRRIEEQSPSQRDLGFKVIAAVAHYGYHRGIKYEVLDALLHSPTKTLARHRPTGTQPAPFVSTTASTETRAGPLAIPVPHRRLGEMLHSACGFLVTNAPVDSLHLATLRTYCKEFHVYAQDNYNESLLWAHAQLDFDSVVIDTDGGLAKSGNRSVKRSQTAKVGGKDRAVEQGPFPPAETRMKDRGGSMIR